VQLRWQGEDLEDRGRMGSGLLVPSRMLIRVIKTAALVRLDQG
jgi:hypothetical protein